MKRRALLKTVAAAGVCASLRGSSGAVELEGPSHPGLLDTLRDTIHRWTESLWDPARNGFRQNDQIGVNLMSTTDVAWMRYAVNDPDLEGGHRDAWIRTLQKYQDPKTGLVRYDPRDGGLIHSNGHGLWHTVRALNILGGQLLCFPHHLRSVMTARGLETWFDSVPWDKADSGAHHEILGIVPLLANLDDPAWTDTFYRKIAEQQDADTGGFPRGKMNISRTFAYTSLHLATRRMIPRAEKIVDGLLARQEPSGFWERRVQFHTMDAAYVLVRLPPLLKYRVSESRQALSRFATSLVSLYRDKQEEVLRSTHRTLAFVHMFGLAQEAFPKRFPSDRPYRFDWDKPSLYRCEVIRSESKRK